MSQAGRVHTNIGKRDTVPMEDVFRQLNCEPTDTCRKDCVPLAGYIASRVSATAVDLVKDRVTAVNDCDGPRSKLFGGVACGAGLK